MHILQDAGEDDKAKALRKLARKIKKIEGLRFDFDGLLRGYSLYSIYVLYWYKSTKTDAESAARGGGASEQAVSRYAPPADLVLKYLALGTRISHLYISSYNGLHHHAADPADAGYTIPELLRLSRSAFSGRRTLALQIPAAILLLFPVIIIFFIFFS
jgi:hypothetical protein